MLTDKIKQELDKGFSIRDLEILIGLPKNSLSSVLAGKKKLSKVSQRKSERYLENPTDFFEYLTIKELNKKVVNSMEKSNFPDIPKETNQMRGVVAAIGSEIKSSLKSTETKKESKVDNSFEKHKLWKEGDPKENSNSFFMKYECWNYSELETIKAHKHTL